MFAGFFVFIDFSMCSVPPQDDETISPSDTNPVSPKVTLRWQLLPQPPSLSQGDKTGKKKCFGKVLLKQLEAVAAVQQSTVKFMSAPCQTYRKNKENKQDKTN